MPPWDTSDGPCSPSVYDENAPLLPSGPISNLNNLLSPGYPSALEHTSPWDSEHRIDIPLGATESPSGNSYRGPFSIDSGSVSDRNISKTCLNIVKRTCCGVPWGTLVTTLTGCAATYGYTRHSGTTQVMELCSQAVNAGFKLASCST